MKQREALKILQRGENVFLTGAAGSGKTWLLNKFLGWLKRRKVRVGVTASTGIAATHLGGITIHSWAGIGIARNATPEHISHIVAKRHVASRLQDARVLVIDEISMLDADRLDLVNRVAKAAREDDRPFGGLQVVLCGDFFQLPPVNHQGEPLAFFAYLAAAWKELNPIICYLDEQHRQADDPLLRVLNAMRQGKVTETEKEVLRSRQQTSADAVGTKLYCRNVNVDAENEKRLQQLSGETSSFGMVARGAAPLVETLRRGCLAPEVLQLKRGAKVMFVRNNFDKGYVNGTLGTVEDFDEEGWPLVKSLHGKTFLASPESWKIEEGDKTVASITQVPLRLAWAITVHKSQGMTLDAAEINLTDAFEPGMGYVALSRATGLKGIHLAGFNDRALQVHPEVAEFDQMLRRQSEQAVASLRQ